MLDTSASPVVTVTAWPAISDGVKLWCSNYKRTARDIPATP
jgi:hypothetical protein